MKRVPSKMPAEQQQVEMPDDLSIPDFLRRTLPATAAQRAETRQQSPPVPRAN